MPDDSMMPEETYTLVCPVCAQEKIRRLGVLYTAEVPIHCGKVMWDKEALRKRREQEASRQVPPGLKPNGLQ